MSQGVDFLVFGARGYFGSHLVKTLEAQKRSFAASNARVEFRDQVEKEIDQHKPKYVLNAAGLAGTPNIDWFESHQQEGIRVNILGALNVADVCAQKNLHCTTFGTGFLYTYDDAHPKGSGIGFKEDEPANYAKPYYCKLRIWLEDMLKAYPNVLNLRISLPVTDDDHPKSLYAKLVKFAKIIDIPNSISIIDDLWPLIPVMAEKNITGTFNFTNPGCITNSEILDAYKRHVDPAKTWEIASAEEAANVQKAGRPNHELDVSKMLALFPDVPHVKVGIDNLMKRVAAHRAAASTATSQ